MQALQKIITYNDPTNIWQLLSEEIRSANIKFINFKQVRTLAKTHWLKQYYSRQVQYTVRHGYAISTENYLINDVEDIQDDIAKFHPTN